MVVQPLLRKYLFHRTFACQAVFSPCVCGWPWLRKHLRTCHCWQHGCPWGQLLYPVKSQCHRFQLCLYSFLTVTKSFLVWGRAWGHVQWCLTESEDYNWGGTSAMTKGTLKPPEGQQIWHDVSAGPAEAFQALWASFQAHNSGSGAVWPQDSGND